MEGLWCCEGLGENPTTLCINPIIMVIILSSCFLSCSLRFSSISASANLLLVSHSSVTSMNLVKIVDSSSEPSQSFLFSSDLQCVDNYFVKFVYIHIHVPLFLVVPPFLPPAMTALSPASSPAGSPEELGLPPDALRLASPPSWLALPTYTVHIVHKAVSGFNAC